MIMRKICVVTGSRAEYGIMSGFMNAINDDSDLQLQIIATNMHLSPEFGLTYQEIEKDGFHIDKKIEMLLSSDTSVGTSKSVGLGSIGFADAYKDLKPDIVVVLGDRFELLSAVPTALFFKIPVAHLCGGDITEGAYDDCIRHSISKMSHLHFVTNEESRKRVIQLGEQPDRVFNVGSLGVENIKKITPLTKNELETDLGFKFGEKSIVVTYHPVTLENHTAKEQIDNLLQVLDEEKSLNIIFTYPNSDTDGRVIIDEVNKFVARNSERSIARTSLGLKRYLSALRYTTAVVGNSSSGIAEVPSFGIPTLNIGDRQKGRLCSDSVYHCGTSAKAIHKGLLCILSDGVIAKAKMTQNPYEGVNTTENILNIIKTYPLDNIIEKHFYDIDQ